MKTNIKQDQNCFTQGIVVTAWTNNFERLYAKIGSLSWALEYPRSPILYITVSGNLTFSQFYDTNQFDSIDIKIERQYCDGNYIMLLPHVLVHQNGCLCDRYTIGNEYAFSASLPRNTVKWVKV